MTKLVLSCAFVCALLTPCAVRAQALYGSIVGNVKDSSEAVVAGATVTLINVDTKQSRETTTSDTGGYAATRPLRDDGQQARIHNIDADQHRGDGQ